MILNEEHVYISHLASYAACSDAEFTEETSMDLAILPEIIAPEVQFYS